MTTAILLPCFNEEQTIETVIRDFAKEMPHADIYVYDNNSTDRSVEITKTLMKEFPKLHLGFETRQGKGNVIKKMFREIDADCYIMADSDATYPASFAREFEAEILEGRADMCAGDRLSGSYKEENKRAFHMAGNVLVKNLVNRLFKANLKDIMTGARGFSYEFVKSYPALCGGFEVETDMTIFALQEGFTVTEKKIEYLDRPAGSSSKLNTFVDGSKVLTTILKVYRSVKPFNYFTATAFILMAIALAAFLPIFVQFIETGTVERIPTLITCSGVAISSLLTFFSGCILSVLKRYRSEAAQQHRMLVNIARKS